MSVSKVGCAASSSNNGGPYAVWFACDYSYGNMQTTPVYVPGKTASLCTKGPNSQWTGLCNPDEPYDVYASS